MPRAPRRDAPGAIHHVMVRGIDKRQIFRDDSDREDFLHRLWQQTHDAGTACFAWALMPNHAHLVLRTGVRPLSELMRRLNTGYAIVFNRRYERSGYLFQDRFRSIMVEDDAYLRVLLRYIHLNPLRAGLVPSLEALATYPWSGHAGLMGCHRRGFQSVEEVLNWFGSDLDTARTELVRLMGEEGAATSAAYPNRHEPSQERRIAPHSSQDGPEPRGETERTSPSRAVSLRARGWNMDTLIAWVCREWQVDPIRIRRGARAHSESAARAVIGHFATHDLGYTAKEAGLATGVSVGPMSRAIRRGASLVAEREVRIPNTPPATPRKARKQHRPRMRIPGAVGVG
ncbi:MAG: transposase [Deltaproteobacteria bacterium]|nr:transposase [Deltaproteobacteria bacterium]